MTNQEIFGNYQYELDMTGQLPIVCVWQRFKKELKYKGTVLQLFVDFMKVYSSAEKY